MIKANWDIKSADNCKLPTLIPDICNSCRDKAYCDAKHNKQITIEEVLYGKEV